MGRYKVVMTHRERKHEMTFIINFSTEEELQKEMQKAYAVEETRFVTG